VLHIWIISRIKAGQKDTMKISSIWSKAIPFLGGIVTISGFLNIFGIKIPKLIDVQLVILNHVPYKVYLPISLVVSGILLVALFIIVQKHNGTKERLLNEMRTNEIP
jgi:hypothetical protein